MAFQKLRSDPGNLEAVYFATFLLALAFGNSPPDALGLLGDTFETVHTFFETAYKHPELSEIAHESWIIMDPLVPHLSFVFEWDKCERLRRGLVEAFVKHQWPVTELNNLIHDSEVLRAIIRSARRVDGGSYYFRALEK